MTKILLIDGCDMCSYLNPLNPHRGRCGHSEGNMFVELTDAIPEECPLPDLKDEEVEP